MLVFIPVSKPDVCEQWGKSFNERSPSQTYRFKPSKGDLHKHVRIHTGVKPYQYELCNKTLTQKPDLQSHFLTYTGVNPHVCNVCHEAYLDRSTLQKHVLAQHSVAK
ncbi:hypothetical protein JTE90_009056 [Oedothorax gibbosus]|uniref:C2H2-type domain-containing protein n=1 Tax=Oedothorax gibbosus TaxID=931172 RepID=A0AAV6VL72_9ARAC|nr:hypothetical protein JTE90_009056 [Oedothorax gibbosus]